MAAACLGPTDGQESAADKDSGQFDADADGARPPADCDDDDNAVFPGAEELCNGVDDDCNTWIDDNPVDASTWYGDGDGDGYGDSGSVTMACDAPAGTAASGGDCDDSDEAVHPGATESCDLFDSDCDGADGGECAPTLTGELEASIAAATVYGEAVGDMAGRHNGHGDIDGDGLPELWTWSIRKETAEGDDYSAIDVFELPATGMLVAGTDSIAQRTGTVGVLIYDATTTGDVDGDGIADLAISDLDTIDGQVYMERGPIEGEAPWEAASDAIVAGDSFYSETVDCAGDLTGDGLDDIVLITRGLPPEKYNGGGGAMVLAWPLEATTDASDIDRVLYWPDSSIWVGPNGASIHDTDGDGIAEVLVGMTDTWAWTSTIAWFEHGPINTLQPLEMSDTTFAADPERTHQFGSLEDLGDLDGDGRGEFGIVVQSGDLGTSPFNGFWIHSDPLGGNVDATTGWAHFYSHLYDSALSNPSVGDIDGDGAADMIFRAYPDNCPNGDDSALYIAYGPIAGTIEVEALPDRICGGEGDEGIGYTSDFLGDTDGDGFEEFVVGSSADRSVSPGKAWIFRGSPRGQ